MTEFNRRFYDRVSDDKLDNVVESGKFAELFAQVAGLVIRYQDRVGPKLPKDIFLKFVEMAREYCCTEILVKNTGDDILLKKRNDPTAKAGEQDWEGKLHIPGTKSNFGFRKQEETIDYLLKKEVLMEGVDPCKYSGSVNPIGFLVYPEPERKTTAPTVLYEVTIDTADLQPDFEIADENMKQVIDQHKPTILWYRQGSERPWVFDTRSEI